MKRRALFKRLGVIALAVAVVPKTAEAAPSEDLGRPWRELTPEQRHRAWEMEEAARRAGQPALTFEAMAADCAARGCELGEQYSIENLAHEFAHWQEPYEWPDPVAVLRLERLDLPRVDAWRRSLHGDSEG